MLEGTESNATSVADGDKRVKRRLLMGMQSSLFLGPVTVSFPLQLIASGLSPCIPGPTGLR